MPPLTGRPDPLGRLGLRTAWFCEQCGTNREQLGDEFLAPIRECPTCRQAACPNCWNIVGLVVSAMRAVQPADRRDADTRAGRPDHVRGDGRERRGAARRVRTTSRQDRPPPATIGEGGPDRAGRREPVAGHGPRRRRRPRPRPPTPPPQPASPAPEGERRCQGRSRRARGPVAGSIRGLGAPGERDRGRPSPAVPPGAGGARIGGPTRGIRVATRRREAARSQPSGQSRGLHGGHRRRVRGRRADARGTGPAARLGPIRRSDDDAARDGARHGPRRRRDDARVRHAPG